MQIHFFNKFNDLGHICSNTVADGWLQGNPEMIFFLKFLVHKKGKETYIIIGVLFHFSNNGHGTLKEVCILGSYISKAQRKCLMAFIKLHLTLNK